MTSDNNDRSSSNNNNNNKPDIPKDGNGPSLDWHKGVLWANISFFTQSNIYRVIKYILLLYGFVDRNRKCECHAGQYFWLLASSIVRSVWLLLRVALAGRS